MSDLPEIDRPRPAASARLSASWRRSADYGVSLDAVTPAFTGSVDEESLYQRCGTEVVTGLRDGLTGEPVSVMLTDADGIVLTRMCEESELIRSLDSTYLAPGFAFSEREAGTNGLGLALADRTPSLVRADEHYCTSLHGYTCAAAPVLDPLDGTLLGSVNLTTWSERSAGLLLALAQTAAGHINALMLAGRRGAVGRPLPRGEVFRVYESPRATAPSTTLSEPWREALTEVVAALEAGACVGVVGEPGVGKTALLTVALQRVHARHRILKARPPLARDAEAWLRLWSPELAKPDTAVIAGRVHELPTRIAAELAAIIGSDAHSRLSMTARRQADIPEPLARALDLVVELPPLRLRPADILPLAHHFAHRDHPGARFTEAATRALRHYPWPGNAEQLRRAVSEACRRSTVVDVRHLPPEVLSAATKTLTRIEALERDELVRCLTDHRMTVTEAADTLGISRATAYRRVQRYGIPLTRP